MSILIKNLCKSFDGKEVLNGFNAILEKGRCSCIMGPSGCGKTTLFNIILGLEKPDSGTIEGLPDKISVVFQENRLCQSLSAEKNIRLVTGRKISQAQICDVLSNLALDNTLDLPVSQLSGGMQRRVSIARALLYDAPLILMDEPFKGLDKELRKQVMDYIRDVCQERTLIFITHDETEAEYLADNIIYIDKKDR